MKYNFKRLIAQRAASDLSNSHQQRTIKDIHISHVFFRYNTKVTLKIIVIWCIYIKGKEKKPSLIPQETCPNIRHVFFGPRNNLQPQHQVHRSLLFHTKMSNAWSQIWTKILFKKISAFRERKQQKWINPTFKTRFNNLLRVDKQNNTSHQGRLRAIFSIIFLKFINGPHLVQL